VVNSLKDAARPAAIAGEASGNSVVTVLGTGQL
jgi:hypothetical protein